MISVEKIINHLIVFVCLLYSLNASSAQVARLDVQYGANVEQLDILLFDSVTPNTVQNFLKYVDDGAGSKRYNDSFFHRAIDDFVLQGGGYKFDEVLGGFEYDLNTGAYTGGLQKIPEDAPIVNEFAGSGLSNLRGTLAMAKLSGDPDSATSQWFINLRDNSTNLDTQNGGFTVFGRVLDAGMDIIDQIMALPQTDLSYIHPAMGDVPIDNYAGVDVLTKDNFARIIDINIIARPVLKTSPEIPDFGLVEVGQTVTLDLTLENIGDADLIMDSSSLQALNSPFSLVAETCSGQVLRPLMDNCSVTISYSPVAPSIDKARLEIIPSSNPENVVLSTDVIAEAVPTTPVLYFVNGVTTFDYGTVAIDSNSNALFVVQNKGGGILTMQNSMFSGVNADQFKTDGACDGVSLSIGQTCEFVVGFYPTTEMELSAVLSIQSSAGNLDVALIGQGAGPEIDHAPLELDFGGVPLNETAVEVINVRNLGVSQLRLNNIAITGADASNFSQQNTCPDVATLPPDTLAPNTLCLIIVSFSPTTSGDKQAMLTFTSNDIDEPTLSVPLSGFVADPDIDTPLTVNAGVSQIGVFPSYKTITISNQGRAPLIFSSYNLTGANQNLFAVATNCPGIATYGTIQSLDYLETCDINLQFAPDEEGVFFAQLDIQSNDPDESTVNIMLTGIGDLDVDGIMADEEAAAPNNGDGNNDNVADDRQNNVVSLRGLAGVYLTLFSTPGSILFDVDVVDVSSIGVLAQEYIADHGVVSFSTDSIPATGRVQILLIMPSDDASERIYSYGRTIDNETPHWYEFDYDGETGAEFLGRVSIEPPGGGVPIQRNVFSVTFVDGKRGDVDGALNNTLSVNIAPVYRHVASSNAASGGYSFLLMFLLLCLLKLNKSRCYLSLSSFSTNG